MSFTNSLKGSVNYGVSGFLKKHVPPEEKFSFVLQIQQKLMQRAHRSSSSFLCWVFAASFQMWKNTECRKNTNWKLEKGNIYYSNKKIQRSKKWLSGRVTLFLPNWATFDIGHSFISWQSNPSWRLSLTFLKPIFVFLIFVVIYYEGKIFNSVSKLLCLGSFANSGCTKSRWKFPQF